MLSRSQRLISTRRLPSSLIATRFASSTPSRLIASQASTSTSSSSSSSSTPPPSFTALKRSGQPLYTVPPLPPLAPPLPADANRHGVSSSNSSSSPHSSEYAPTPQWSPSPQSQEQLAVLNACLASGDIFRAEEVARRIRLQWMKEGSNEPLSNVLTSKVHADFLRAYLSGALIKVLATPDPIPLSSTSSSSSSSAASTSASPSTSSMSNSKNPVGEVRANLVAKAWSYFDSLNHEQWEDRSSSRNEAIDCSVLAVMFKGLVRCGRPIYDPSRLTDPEAWLRPLTALLTHVKKHRLSLGQILKDPIFLVELPSYLGRVTPIEVIEALERTGEGRGGWDAWSDQIESLKIELHRDQERRNERQELEVKQAKETAELVPTTKSKSVEGGPENQEVSYSLQTLRTNLSTLGMPDGALISPAQRQRLLEESSYDAARQLYIHEMEELAKIGKDKERNMQTDWLQGVMYEWMQKMEDALVQQRQSVDQVYTYKARGRGPNTKENDTEPFMRLLSPSKMALITIVELLRLCGGGGVSEGMKAARGILDVGRAIEHEYHAQVLQQSYPRKEFEQELENIAKIGTLMGNAPAHTTERALDIFWRRELAKKEKDADPSWRPSWTRNIQAKVGSMLVTCLMEVAKVERTIRNPVTGEVISEIQPAFSHTYQYVRGKRLGVIKVNPVVAERISTDPMRITLHPRFLPMVVKPKPWLSFNSGAYLVHSTSVMRTKDSDEQIQYLKQASDADNLDDIFTGLDVLGGVSWKINRQIFDVVSEVWNSGEELADIPPAGMLSLPIDVEKPDGVDKDLRALDIYRRRIRQVLQERRAAHSNRCDVNYKLEIARAFLGEKFYFPHNLDFRGRAYPIPPNLSHIGDDLCRGLLLFGEAKPLGDRGLRWLKIHLANTAGFDKASFDEREAFAMEHLEDVYDSADRPLEGKRWWLKADDPWQCLATCIELTKALRAPEPTEYECALPIHQDGTCNGLQHYAALGGDLKGANQVNLEAGDRPADVYSAVANQVNTVIERDVKKGVKEAIILQGKVSRKVVKQTVMTTVYGVTFIGAKKQIEKQLKDRGDVAAEHLYTCSVYLGKLVLASITDAFKGATSIQQWLSRSARIISKSIPPGRISSALQSDRKRARGRPKSGGETPAENDPELSKTLISRIPKELMTSVVWTTPLGLPVVQPYRKDRKRQVSTALQTVYISDPSIPAEVDTKAQATAFPPNFIHSLDATHMMMTALACKDKIAFASVHDSYWTHACSVDEMSVTLREAFIELHSQDILGRLRSEFLERYKGHVIPVNRVPSGLRYGEPDTDGNIKFTNTESKRADASSGQDLITELEAQDGPSTLPLFTQKISNSDLERSREPETSIGLEDDLSTTPNDPTTTLADEEAAEMWRVPTAKGFNSKFVFVTDVIPPVPQKGDFDLDKIRSSLYFFS